MKECEQKRNLAFYKRSGEPWTQEEYKAVCKWCCDLSDEDFTLYSIDTKVKYIFDDGYDNAFLYPWSYQEKNHNFKNCKQVAYEDIFNEDGTVKGEHMEEEVIIKNQGELIDLLRSGGKWTSEMLEDGSYCYYDEEYRIPFRHIHADGSNNNMTLAWGFDLWRKVKPQFKTCDLVMFWGDESGTSFHVGIWDEDKPFGVGGFDHYEPYTGPVPKHIQDFIDEMKAKEK